MQVTVLVDGQDAVGISDETYDGWEVVRVGEEQLWYDSEVAEQCKKEPTACVLMNWCGIDVNLQCVVVFMP